MRLIPKLYFRYLAKHYFINFLALLMGLSMAFAMIDYFQHSQQLGFSSNYTILYIFLMWQEALAQLYPIAIVFAGIMTKMALIKSSNMVALHSFGYTKRQLFAPFFTVALTIYLSFMWLQTTEFSYAKDKATAMLEDGMRAYALDDLFFIYEDDFVYAEKLDPIKKEMKNITIFRVNNNNLLFTVVAKEAKYNGKSWIAKDITIKRLIYDKSGIKKYATYRQDELETLVGYKPKVIESMHEGKALDIIDMGKTFKLLDKQHLNTKKLRSSIYGKVVFPLFSIILLLVLFFKIPFHARYMNLPLVLSVSLGATFLFWGLLFAFNQMGRNGVLSPELAMPLPILIGSLYALYVYFLDREKI
ncbi:Permease YjgP/YjgQ [hydrothermal vent metagenome]|uniref:Permease YjgP/YjgQ n=1 Tax=hydrothermal vent metagenome TaxID=652676 RepID=A0A1W1BYA5_9ZZZZ